MATMTAERDMAKAKKPKRDEPAGDWFQLKLPVEYWHALQLVEQRTGRAMSVTAQIALERYFKLAGIPFNPNWPAVE